MRVNIPKFNPLPYKYVTRQMLDQNSCIHLRLPKEIFIRLQFLTTGNYKQIGKVELVSLLIARLFNAMDKEEATIPASLPRYLYPNNRWPKSKDW